MSPNYAPGNGVGTGAKGLNAFANPSLGFGFKDIPTKSRARNERFSLHGV